MVVATEALVAVDCENVVEEPPPVIALVLSVLEGPAPDEVGGALGLACGALLCFLDVSPPTRPPTRLPMIKISTTKHMMSVLLPIVTVFLLEAGASKPSP